MKPQHAVLFATDLDDETLIQYIDRFLMFYVRTADRLQRTGELVQQPRGRHRLPAQRHRRRQRSGSAPSWRPRWRTSSTPTNANGRRRSADPEKLRQFRPVREHRRARSQHRARPRARPAPARDLGGEGAARPGAGARGVGLVERRPPRSRVARAGSTSARVDDITPDTGVAALIGDLQIAIVRVGDGGRPDLRGRQLRSVQPRVRDRARHRRRSRGHPQDRVAHLQAELRPHDRPVSGRPGRTAAHRTRRGCATAASPSASRPERRSTKHRAAKSLTNI